MIAYETGISPLALLDCPGEVFDALLSVRNDHVAEVNKQQRGRR